MGYIYLSRCETHGAVHTEAHVWETHTCGQGKSTRWCDYEQPLTIKMTRGSKTGSLKRRLVYTRVCSALTCWNADVVGKDCCTLPTAHVRFELLSRRSLWERKQHRERDILGKEMSEKVRWVSAKEYRKVHSPGNYSKDCGVHRNMLRVTHTHSPLSFFLKAL